MQDIIVNFCYLRRILDLCKWCWHLLGWHDFVIYWWQQHLCLAQELEELKFTPHLPCSSALSDSEDTQRRLDLSEATLYLVNLSFLITGNESSYDFNQCVQRWNLLSQANQLSLCICVFVQKFWHNLKEKLIWNAALYTFTQLEKKKKKGWCLDGVFIKSRHPSQQCWDTCLSISRLNLNYLESFKIIDSR